MRSADGRLCFSMARACSNSSRLRASTDCNVTPKARAPTWTSLKEDFWSGFAGFQRKATRDIFGTASFASHRRKRKGQQENEPDQPHQYLGGGWLAGSLTDGGCSRERAALVDHVL